MKEELLKSLIQKVSSELFDSSGSVFYSGKSAFRGKKPLYILGLNPGGSPEDQSGETVKASIAHIAENWSAYRDDSWQGAPGTHGMQPVVLHLLNKLELSPEAVPASNLIFIRSRIEADISANTIELAEMCWPFHETVVSELQPKAILCFGKTVGRFVRKKLMANTLIGEFIEKNKRNWTSQVLSSPRGVKVIVATHPSRADWRNPQADPSEMIKRALVYGQ